MHIFSNIKEIKRFVTILDDWNVVSDHILIFRQKRSEEENEENSEQEENTREAEKDESKENRKDDCDNKVIIDAFGGNYTLCLYLRPFKEEPIVKESYDTLNVSIFNYLNVSDDVSITTYDLYSAIGHVIEGI